MILGKYVYLLLKLNIKPVKCHEGFVLPLAKRIPIIELSIKLPEKVLGRQSWSLPAVEALGEETAGESFGETMVGQKWEYLDLDLRLPNGNVMCQIHDPGVFFLLHPLEGPYQPK